MYLWIIIPFFLIHSIIPHKEERFLFPLVYLFPVVLATGYEKMVFLTRSRKIKLLVNYILLISFVLFNIPSLIVMSSKSAGFGEMEITKFIHNNYGNTHVNLISVPWSDPYNPFGLKAGFYTEKNIRSIQIKNLCELNDSLLIKGQENLVVVRKIYLENDECMKKLADNNFILIKRSIPEPVEWMNKFYQGFKSSEFLMLYRQSK